MLGTFVDQGGLFSYIAPEARVPANHPLRKIRELVRDVLGELTRGLGRLYASEGPPRSAIAVAQCAAASSVLRHPVGTPAYGAIGLQSLVPLVRGTFARRPDLGPDDLHEGARSAADRRGVCQVHQQTSEPSGGQAAVVGRAFFRGDARLRCRIRSEIVSKRTKGWR